MAIPQTLINATVEAGALGFDINDPPYAFEEFNGRWVYTRGYAIALLELREKITQEHPLYALICANHVKGHITHAIMHAHTYWLKLWAAGDWRRCSHPQINDAHRTERMRFDKAWLAVGALIRMCETVDPTFDWAAYVKICPAVFSVENFTAQTLESVRQANLLPAMSAYAFQTQLGGINSLANNYTVTYRTAQRVSEFLNNNNFGPTAVLINYDPAGIAAKEDVIHVNGDGTPRAPSKKQKNRLKP